MLKNYLKIAWRNVVKDKGYSLINIISLTIGVGIFLFMLLLAQYAWTYDSFYPNNEQIFRVVDEIKTNDGNEIHTAQTPWRWAPGIEQDFPEVASAVRVLIRGKAVRHQQNAFNIAVSYVDSTFFKVFQLSLATGDARTALQGTNSVVISAEIAKLLFGNNNPRGQLIEIGSKSFEVSGVLEKLPANSSIAFEILAPAASITPSDLAAVYSWKAHEAYTYLLLNEGAKPQAVENRLDSFVQSRWKKRRKANFPRICSPCQMYLSTGLQQEHGGTLNPSYVFIFFFIGLLILLISCINFINISTARAARRNREVGVRKVVGASRGQLALQYLFEVGIIVLFSLVIAIVLVECTLPIFNNLTGEWQVQIRYTDDAFFWESLGGIFVFVTLVAGAYPAFYLSGFQPVRIFGARSASSTRSLLRSGLVVAQFTLAVFLLLCSLVVNQQIQFLRQKDLGFAKDNLVRLYMWEGMNLDKAERFRREILENPQIEQAAFTSDGPVSGGDMVKYRIADQNGTPADMIVRTLYVDPRFIPIMQLKLTEGRNFSSELASDSSLSIIINQTAAREFGWLNAKNVIGNTIRMETKHGNMQEASVIGVINDYNFELLDQPIKPLVLRYNPSELSNLLVRVHAPDAKAVNSYLHKTWKSYFPGQFFFYYYVSDLISESYTTESIISQLLGMFTWLTIFIAGLGLLGLASYTILQRTKEVGVRKVMGASTGEIVGMFSKEFLRYVAAGILIGIPLAYLAVNSWLQNFAYHVEISLGTILIVIASIIVIAFGTVSWQSIKAALQNPVESLRSE